VAAAAALLLDQARPEGMPMTPVAVAVPEMPHDSKLPVSAPAHMANKAELPCVVCMAASRNILIFPCRHICVCTSCATSLGRFPAPACPMCRGPIQSTLDVFL
jgi:hypothetical protein